MKKVLLTTAKFVLFLGLGVLLVWLVFKDQNWDELKEGFQNANYLWVGLSIIAAFFAHLSRALRWNILVKPLGKEPRSINSFLAVMIGYLGNLALPRLGEILRPGVLKKYEKIPFSGLMGTIVVERAFDMLILIILIFLAMLLQFDLIVSFFSDTIYNAIAEKFLAGRNKTALFLGVLGGLLVMALLTFLVLRRIRHTKFYEKFQEVLRKFYEGIVAIGKMERKWLFLFHTVVIWAGYYFMTYLCFFSTEPTMHLGVVAGLSVLTLGALGVVAPVQGGIGAYHWIVSQTLIMYGVSETDGLIFATITHAAQIVFILVAGSLSLILIPIFNKEN